MHMYADGYGLEIFTLGCSDKVLMVIDIRTCQHKHDDVYAKRTIIF